jgi:capsule polysaccharide export protein KpsE/RkpR
MSNQLMQPVVIYLQLVLTAGCRYVYIMQLVVRTRLNSIRQTQLHNGLYNANVTATSSSDAYIV